ncbi:MAG: hypothetical protein ABI591_28670, partial [Kofleriaceae bacterium]
TAPLTAIELTDNAGATDFHLTQISLDESGTLVVAPKNTNFRLQFDWAATDTACGGGNCRDQLEVGFHQQGSATAGHRSGCAIDQAISNVNVDTGAVDIAAYKTPNSTGVYELRIHIAQNLACTYNGANDYYGGEPTMVMALFCLR